MIRLLILLITLNAIFPVAGLASVCASNSPELLNTSHVSTNNNGMAHNQVAHTDDATVVFQSQHCDDPEMSCNDQNMTSMDCDSGCCVSCLGVSATMTTSLPDFLLPSLSIKPTSGYINFYTRSISPELQPPLV